GRADQTSCRLLREAARRKHGMMHSISDNACSFCRKKRRDAGPLVEGQGPSGLGGVLICRQCALLCLDILDQEERRRAGETWSGLTESHSRANTVAGLIRELRAFDDQTLEVRICFDLREPSHAIAHVALID